MGGRGDGGKRRRDVEETMDLGALPLADIGRKWTVLPLVCAREEVANLHEPVLIYSFVRSPLHAK